MPYIKEEDRKKLNSCDRDAKVPGELNYIITEELQMYVSANGLSYQTINDILGALEGAKLEFVRRVVNPYEDKKILENGDVYHLPVDGGTDGNA